MFAAQMIESHAYLTLAAPSYAKRVKLAERLHDDVVAVLLVLGQHFKLYVRQFHFVFQEDVCQAGPPFEKPARILLFAN